MIAGSARGQTMPAEMDAWPLECPVCGAPLTRTPATLVCPQRHSYDIAREGYVNLLAAQHRERGIEGDDAGMVRARRRFLDAGHFAPLRDRLAAIVGDALREPQDAAAPEGIAGGPRGDARERICVGEVGCGVGYYIGGIADALTRSMAGRVGFVGIDVSRAAVRLAARRYRDVTFIVANARRRIYLQTASASVLLNVFAPRNAAEFARVTRSGGSLVVVIPHPAHLASVRTELGLIDIGEDKEETLVAQLGDDFSLAHRETLRFPLTLSAEAIEDVVAMGPNRWHRRDAREDARGPASTEAAFVVVRFHRR
jgi:23S rRNA (guanine745-N1)-methyltransferase